MADDKFKTVTKSDYFRALKLISECKAERIPYIIEALRAKGIELPDCQEALLEAEDRKRIMRKNNSAIEYESFPDSDDEVALAIREAYKRGISMSVLAEQSGVHRVTLYTYITGKKVAQSQKVRENILNAVSKLIEKCDEVEAG